MSSATWKNIKQGAAKNNGNGENIFTFVDRIRNSQEMTIHGKRGAKQKEGVRRPWVRRAYLGLRLWKKAWEAGKSKLEQKWDTPQGEGRDKAGPCSLHFGVCSWLF